MGIQARDMTAERDDGRQARAGIGAWTVGLLACAYATLLFIDRPPEPLVFPDSESYLGFGAERTLGYPLFLAVFGADGAIVAQPLLAALALAFLGWQLRRTLGVVLAGGAMLAVIVNVELGTYHHAILTESVFVSLLMVLLGVLARCATRPTIGAIAAASLIVGLAATVRPTGLALLPVLLLAALMLWPRLPRRRATLLVAAVLPALLAVGAERAAGVAVFGTDRASLLPRHLFAKAGMIAAPAAPAVEAASPRGKLIAALERDFAPIRDVVREAPTFATRAHLATNYEICLAYACTDALRARLDVPDSERERLMQEVALERILRAPGPFLGLAWLHTRRLWTPYTASHPAGVSALNRYVGDRRPLPFEARAPVLTQVVAPRRIALAVQPLMLAIGGATAALAIVGLALAMRRANPRPAFTLACTAALAVHGPLVLTALAGVGTIRYTLAFWPAIVVALAAAVQVAIDALGPDRLRTLLRLR